MIDPIPFELKTFLSPPACYAPVYAWLWNAPLTEEEIERQLDEMDELGIKRFYILPLPKNFRPKKQPSKLEPEYLTPRFFEAYRKAVLSAKRRGKEVWLYDEGGWPSGSACGEVIKRNPSLVRETIIKREIVWKKNRPYKADKDTVISFSGTEIVSQGDIFPQRRKITEYRRTFQKEGESAEIPDLTK